MQRRECSNDRTSLPPDRSYITARPLKLTNAPTALLRRYNLLRRWHVPMDASSNLDGETPATTIMAHRLRARMNLHGITLASDFRLRLISLQL